MGCCSSKELKNTLDINENSNIKCIMNKPIISLDDNNIITIKLCADVIIDYNNNKQYIYVIKKKKFKLKK